MNKEIYTIVGIAPKQIQKLLQNVREKHFLPFETSEQESIIILKDTAHFAIKRTFSLKEEISEKELIKRLEKIEFNKEINLNCQKSGTFNQTKYGPILYAKINKEEALENLHLEIKKAIDNISITKDISLEGNNFFPHISFVYNIDKDKIHEAKGILDSTILPFSFNIKQIFLLKTINSEKDTRKIIQVLPII